MAEVAGGDDEKNPWPCFPRGGGSSTVAAGTPPVRILDRYLLTQIALTTLVASGALTFILVVLNAFKRVFELLINNDVPFLTILQMVFLLVPQVLTFTIPWGFLVAVLFVLGRMAHDLEILAIRAAGLGLVPFISPLVLFSLVLSLLCFYNNAVLAPRCITAFKDMLIDLGRNNPTALIRAQEPVDKFDGFRIYVDKKYGNTVEGVTVWELDPSGVPKRSVRADKGIIAADLSAMQLTITLFNARTEERGGDPTNLSKIQTGMRAGQFPLTVPLRRMLEKPGKPKSSNQTIAQLTESIFTPTLDRSSNVVPLLTEFQKRMAISVSCFTFALVGIPLAIYTQRKETSISFVLSLAVVVAYYLLIALAEAFKQKAAAYPEVVVWMPNLIFQTVGCWLIHKVNRHPM
jgi:lipopolysaccharide export system permease protein